MTVASGTVTVFSGNSSQHRPGVRYNSDWAGARPGRAGPCRGAGVGAGLRRGWGATLQLQLS